jgi:hypothetical protein
MKLKLTIAIAVAACLAVCILWVVPSLKRARSVAAANTCINYLVQINAAKLQWGLDNHKATNDVPTWDELVPRYLPRKYKCPLGGIYTLGRLDENPKCSIPGHTLP